MAKGRVRLTEDLPLENVLADTRELATQPVTAAIGAQLLNAGGQDGVFGAPTAFATSPDLEPGQAVFAVRRHYSVGFAADSLRVSAVCGRARAQAAVAVKTVPLADRLSLSSSGDLADAIGPLRC